MQIMVSVLTTAYNHAQFIAGALDSFVKQKTDFAFEVIVHDDASTDGTAEIIREYASKYPDIIRPILQNENQYSKGIDVYDFMEPLVRGKYIALCEGDDYWCDDLKLQKQVDFLEAHTDYVACAHNNWVINYETGKKTLAYPGDGDRDLHIENYLSGNGKNYHTSSIVYRRDKCMGIEDFVREPLLIGGDNILEAYLLLQGKIRFLNDTMSVYRLMSPNSWTKSNSNSQKTISILEDRIRFFEIIDQYTNGAYSEYINKGVLKQEFRILMEKCDYSTLTKPPYRDMYFALPLRDRVQRRAKHAFPGLYSVMRSIRNRMTGGSR